MSNAQNPYQAPEAHIAPPPLDPTALPLASPWVRFVAAFIDGIILWPVQFLLAKLFFHTPTDEEAKAAVVKYGIEGAIRELSPGIGIQLVVQLIMAAAFIAINFVFLKNGQTIGKKLLKLQIQNRSTGTVLSLQDIIVKRLLPYLLVPLVLSVVHPLLALLWLVDVLMIFRKDRNTLHDDLANSKVVKLPA